jgi:predicted nucleic acid-binding protein
VIVLDTNVLSEPLRTKPDAAVLAWLTLSADQALLTSISIGEILYGVRLLTPGRRREGLMAAVEHMLTTYADDVLHYDAPAARAHASIREERRAVGRPLSVEDGMIAAICFTHGAALATRNTNDFAGVGVELVDPWSYRS